MSVIELTPLLYTLLGFTYVAVLIWLMYRIVKSVNDAYSDADDEQKQSEGFFLRSLPKLRIAIFVVAIVVFGFAGGVATKVQPRNDASPINTVLEQKLKIEASATIVHVEVEPTLTLDEKFEAKQKEFKESSEKTSDEFLSHTPVNTDTDDSPMK